MTEVWCIHSAIHFRFSSSFVRWPVASANGFLAYHFLGMPTKNSLFFTIHTDCIEYIMEMDFLTVTPTIFFFFHLFSMASTSLATATPAMAQRHNTECGTERRTRRIHTHTHSHGNIIVSLCDLTKKYNAQQQRTSSKMNEWNCIRWRQRREREMERRRRKKKIVIRVDRTFSVWKRSNNESASARARTHQYNNIV